MEELFFYVTVLFPGIQHTHMIPLLSSNPSKGEKGLSRYLAPGSQKKILEI